MSIVYFGVLISVAALGYLAENNPKCRIKKNGRIIIGPDTGAAILLTIILILVSGLRYRVGTDYFSYYNRRVPEWEDVLHSILHFKEGGFSLLVKLSRIIYDHGQTLIFISAAITIGLSCWTIFQYHTIFLFSIMIYVLAGGWQEGFNGIRQCMAAAIIFAGHRLILEKKIWQYCVVLLVASTIHATSVVMIIPVLLFNRKADLKQIAFLTIAAVIARFSYRIIFSLIESYKEKALNTTSGYLANTVNIFRILVNFIPVIVYIVFCRKDNHTKEQTFYINVLFFNAFSMLAGMGSAYFGRIGIYTGAAVTIGYGHLLQLIEEERTRRAIAFFVLGMYLFFWIYSLDDIRNYRWIFNQS